MEYKVIINNEELTEFVLMPLTEQRTLDESLDQGYVRLIYTSKTDAYRPFINVQIQVKDTFGTIKNLTFFIASDNKSEIIATKTFNHDLLLIEDSKWLERFLIGTKTTTNPLVHDYLSTANYSYITREYIYGSLDNEKYNEYDKYYTSPISYGKTINVKSLYEYDSSSFFTSSVLQIYKDGEILYETTDLNKGYDITAEIGEYTIKYTRNITVSDKYIVTIPIISIKQLAPKPNKTITDVINNLLMTVKTLRESDTPIFTFNEVQAEEYSKIDAPEFTLTGTLWEALKQIGGYIHAIPRLNGTTIYFDKLGSNKITSSDLSEYISNTERFDIEQYASAIDSTVQNIINLDERLHENEELQGSVTYPYENGFMTPRTESGTVIIADNDIKFKTDKPIGRFVALEIGYVGNEYVGYITPYIYEEAEYLGLSSYDDRYPNSRAFALKYKIGQPDITGLTFKLPNPLDQTFSDFAIENIIARKLGRDASWIPNFFKTYDVREIPYRITYIPYENIRVRQKKPYTQELEFDSSLAYNQTAQKVSSNAYGENMKGVIARLGNPEITKVYMFNDLLMIPNVGDLFDEDYYISVVKCEYYNDFVRCEIGLSKNFNKLNEYVGISNEIRFYEISEKQAQDRYVLYEDYCVIGSEDVLADDSLINDKGVKRFADSFTEGTLKNRIPISLVKAKGYSDIDNPSEIAMAVTSFGIGNSLVLSYHYEDNYSAGEQVIKESSKDDPYLQYQVRYTDVYGELETLKLSYGNSTTQATSQEEMVEQGNNLPLASKIDNFESYFETGDNKIVLKKDNREIPTITYQLHFVANKKSIIIGSGIGRTCTFVSPIEQNYKLYILPDRIPKFARLIDLSRATLIGGLKAIQNGEKVSLYAVTEQNPIATTNGSAWVICHENELIVGENINIVNEEEFELPTFTFTHTLNPIVATFNANGGLVNGKESVTYSQKYNSELNLPENPTRTGHIFGGWFTVKYGDNVEVDENNRISAETIFTTNDNGTIYYAYWTTESYTLTFNNGIVNRSSSAVGSTGYLSSGDTIYYGDRISVGADNTRRVTITMGGQVIEDWQQYSETYGYSFTVTGNVEIEIEYAVLETVLQDKEETLTYYTVAPWSGQEDIDANGGTGLQPDVTSQIIMSGKIYYEYSDPNISGGELQMGSSNFNFSCSVDETSALTAFIELTDYGVEIVGVESGRAKAMLKFSIPQTGVLRLINSVEVDNNYFYKIYFEEIKQVN